MIYKNRYIELWVNGNQVELEDQESLNLRFQNVIFNPEKISNTQAEYSFEFEVPATAHNNVIFDYANNLSKLNKFHQRYNAEVYADGTVIFAGTLVINEYKDNMYNLNLVSVKVYSLEDIFGDKTMDKINWYIPFEGGGTDDYTIDYYNSQLDTKVVFPFVSYGAFQKQPYSYDEVANNYTSKYDIDQWNTWYVESFPPSANMLETLKKAFETVGYTVGGDVFQNPLLSNIYMSTNLANEQTTDYNIGNPKFGQVGINSVYSTENKQYYEQELRFPYYNVHSPVRFNSEDGTSDYSEYNLETVYLYDLLDSGATITVDAPSYMYQPYENCIVIPATGFYKIEMSINSTLNTSGNITAMYHLYNHMQKTGYDYDISIPVGFDENTAVEFQLVRNYEDNLELIKGKHNRRYENGDPTKATYQTMTTNDNITEWLTCFPHEDQYASELPTEANDLKSKYAVAYASNRAGTQTIDTSEANSGVSKGGGRRVRGRDGSGVVDRRHYRNYSANKYGYIYNDGEIMAYDQVVSPAFICGLSSFYGGVASVMKNGYSWSNLSADKNDAFYPEIGYSFLSREEGADAVITSEQTDYNYNTYINTPISRCNATSNSLNGYISCIVKLTKNDILKLFEVHRGYTTTNTTPVTYNTTTTAYLKITAFSPRDYNSLKVSHDNRYEAPVEFDEELKVSNFFNKEKPIAEWVQNIADAFNFDILQDGNAITINTRKKIAKNIAAVGIDDRVNSAEARATAIDYPRSMAVKYTINKDEWGFERSAVANAGGNESILNDEDEWIKYGDSGYTTIQLNDDSYITNTSDKNLQFSYTWYENFNWYQVNNQFVKESDEPVTLRIPCISEYSFMIDGYDYDESMKHDGYSLKQRFWFKPSAANCWVWLRTYPTERVQLYTPSNLYTNYRDVYFNLSYKTTEPSILTEFFNLNAYLSANYVTVNVYLTPEEYNRIKNGSLVHFDSDLYIPCELSGYDPTGNNPTTLKMMKKII